MTLAADNLWDALIETPGQRTIEIWFQVDNSGCGHGHGSAFTASHRQRSRARRQRLRVAFDAMTGTG
jgi:hypothetical protein